MPDFATTRWSVVLAAGRGASPDSDAALAELCGRYWYPLYAFVRRTVNDREAAGDLTQAFFARLLERNLLAAARPERGRFRTFLLTCCKHFLLNERDRERAEKRGGGRATLSLDFAAGDARFRREPADTMTPERLYHRQWALSLLGQVLAGLRAEYVAAGKADLFDALKGSLAGAGESYAAIGERLGVTEGAVKIAAHRLRQRYRERLRQEVAQTLDAGEDPDDEIRQLFDCLA
jgi:RNA polymerase sigma-70 factor (ECF subfamily)